MGIVECFQCVDLLSKPVAKAWVMAVDWTLLLSLKPYRVDIVLIFSG
jgi:hypothetical protein